MKLNGRRGAFQLLFGISYAMLGIGWATQEAPPGAMLWIPQWFPAVRQYPEMLPTRISAVLWVTAAVMACIGAFLPRPKDRLSFQALTFVPILWGLFNTLSFITAGFTNGVAAAVLYLAMGGAVMIVSGMSGEHERDLRPVVLDGEELVPPATGPQ